MSERVLVLPRAAVPGGCDFLGVRTAAPEDLLGLRHAIRQAGLWMDRAPAEVDATHKQIIPYVVVRDADRMFLMERTSAGGDARLHRRATIGVGGHLNPVDDGADPLAAGLIREWNEELVADWKPHFSLVGLLNDDRNPVGAVHLGVVFTVDAAGRAVDVREQDKLSGRWAAEDELRVVWRRMEPWSQLVAEALWATS